MTVVLTPPTSQNAPALDTIANQLSLTLTANAVGGRIGQTSATVKAVLESVTISTPAEVASSESGVTILCWHTKLHLRRPEQAMIRPAVQFTATVSRSESSAPIKAPVRDDYMQSGVPSTSNLFEALQSSPAFAGKYVRLPASRLQKVIPRTEPTSSNAAISGSSKMFRIMPAVSIKLNTTSVAGQQILAVDIEVARWADCSVVLQSVQGDQGDGDAGSSLLLLSPGLPEVMKVGDRTTVILQTSTPASAPLSCRIIGHALLGETCKPDLDISIRTRPFPLDSRATMKTTKQWQRQSLQASRPTSLTTTTTQGVCFVFHTPEEVLVGETFHIDVSVINQGIKKRRLALLVGANNSTTARDLRGPVRGSMEVPSQQKIQAVMDAATLSRLHLREYSARADIVSLSADVKIGPLQPGACHETRLDFLVLSVGLVEIDSMTIFDVETKESVQVSEIPTIMAIDSD